MSKKLTSLLLGAIAALLITMPANAQMSQGMSRAEVKAKLLQQKRAPGMKETKQAIDFKRDNHRLFKRKAIQPSLTNILRTANQKFLPANPNVRMDGNRFILKANNTSVIANYIYYPGMGDSDTGLITNFEIGAPTEYNTLATFLYPLASGVALTDEYFYGVNSDFTFASWGFIFVDLYKFNRETWEIEDTKDLSADFSMVADETAIAADGSVYGAFWTADGSGSELAIVDYSVPTRTAIGTIVNTYVALGVTKGGILYGISTDGNLYKIDPATAEETLIGATGVTVADAEGSYYYQTGEIDQKDDTFYWLGVDVNQGTTSLYTVDLTTGAATKVQDLGEYNIVGMCFEKPAANDGAPDKVSDISFAFANGSTTGNVSFTAPTKTYGGGELSGDLTYTIMCGEEVLATGTTTPGATVTAEVTLPVGLQTIVVTTSNAEGESPKAKGIVWVGFDIPMAPTGVTFTMDGNTANVSWTAPAEGIHQGYLGDITYDVYRIAAQDTTLVAENISETSFSETLEVSGLAIYSYGVIAKNDFLVSDFAFSDGQALGDALTVPYYADFNTEGTFNLYSVIDANNDGSTWAWSTSYLANYKYNSSNAADDWLISPPIQLQAGKRYNVIAEMSGQGISYTERFAVMLGNQPTVEALTTPVIPTTEININEFAEFEGTASVEEDGVYYFAIHAMSDADQWYLKIKSLTVELGPEPTAPNVPTDIVVTPNAEGANEATITFNAPTKNIQGDDLTENLTKVEIFRDNALIGAVEDIAPGAAASYTDNAEDLTAGSHVYQLFPYNASGVGQKSEKVSAYIGLDTPSIEGVYASDNISSVTLKWDLPVGENGGIVNPEKTSYLIWDIVAGDYGLEYGEMLDSIVGQNTYDVAYNTNEGEQDYKYWGVQPVNETGKGVTTVGSLIVGKPFEMPLEEHFANQDLQIPGWFFSRSSSYDVSVAFMEGSSDNDGYCIGAQSSAPDSWAWLMPGKINVQGIVNPVMLFDVIGTATSKVYVVIGTPDGNEEKVTADIIPGEEFQTVKVDLKPFADKAYIMPYIYLEFSDAGSAAIDNINFIDLMEYDIAASSIEAPAAITAGTNANILVNVKNWGENAAENYNVKVSVGDEVVFEEAVNEPLAALQNRAFEVVYNTTIFTEGGDKTIKAEVNYDLDLNPDNNTTEAVITVNTPQAAGVENLTAEESHVTWSAPNTVTENKTENFEDITVFPTFQLGGITETAHEGQFGDWKMYDGDGAEVYGWESSSVSYDNAGAPAAWMPFNPVQAGMGEEQYPPFSGAQFMMAQCAVPNTTVSLSDDWIISPELPGIAQNISFYGMQASTLDASSQSFYGYETFEVLVSTTDTNIENFSKIGEGQISSEGWEKFSYDLPEGTKYFAIRHTSKDVFALFIDDVAYIAGGGSIASYNVYVDEVFYKNVTDTSIDLDLPEGDHKISVTIVYSNGVESAPVSVNTTITAIESILANGNPVDIYTIDGILVRSQATSAAGLKAGVYIVNGKKAMVR